MIRGVGRLDHVLRVVRAPVSKGVKRDYVRVVEAYRDDAGKTQHRTIINLGRRDLLADALMELALQFEATHFAQMDHQCCCPSSCLADIAAARCNSPLRPLLLCQRPAPPSSP